MPRVITEPKLKDAIRNRTFIKNGAPDNAEGIKYDFRMSSRVLKSAFNQPVDITKLPEEQQAALAIEPGEVVFVLTEEELDLPKNVKADLSQKRRMSHQGIMAVGGFCIDPLYKGYLLIGLYNFSSSPFPLRPGIKLIAAVFYELQEEEVADFPTPAPIYDFPDELVRLMKNYRPVSAEALMEAVKRMEVQFEDMRKEFRARDEWYDKFQGFLERHDGQIGKLLAGLDGEKEERRRGEDLLRGHLEQGLQSFQRELATTSKMAIRTAAIVATIAGIIIPVLITLLLFLFKAYSTKGG